ncbi:MAG: hypothetical protein JWR69_2029, partial [Pedosphaera sp.]|nr:hypothetical protein [Pedosphaera sp.]
LTLVLLPTLYELSEKKAEDKRQKEGSASPGSDEQVQVTKPAK